MKTLETLGVLMLWWCSAPEEKAAEIQTVLDKVIGDCTMQGPDHDALHLWLHPLLERVDVLKSSTTTAEARLSYITVDDRVRLYHTYFS